MRAFCLSVLAVISALVALPAFAQETRRVTITQNADYFGFDLRTERNVTQAQCSAICLADPACRAFTYNTSAQWCFLKSDFNVLNPFPGAIAGKIEPVSGAPDIGAAPELSFLPNYVTADAVSFRQRTLAAANSGGAGLAALVGAAEAALARNDARAALINFQNALSILPDDPALWIGMARAANGITASGGESQYYFYGIGTGASLIGYRLTRTAADRAEALAVMGTALERRSIYRPAMTAYQASLDLAPSLPVEDLLDDLRARQGFRVVDHRVDSDSLSPRICVQFSETLARSGVDYAQFVSVAGAPGSAIDAGEKEICVEGLQHGGQYQVTIRQGLPAAIGETIRADVDLDIYVRDRAPSIRFTGENFVLPGSARRGIPLVSVNTDSVKVSVFRIGERALSRVIDSSQVMRQLDGYDLDRISEELGAPVWEGDLDVASELNKDVVTSFPVDEAIPDRKPGVYVMSARPQNDTSEGWQAKATQWFVVSDIGLTTFDAQDGLSVFARSLASADPLAGVELELVARNNEILGTARTDADGRARFDPGLMRGASGQAPAAILARTTNDFIFLDLTRAGFDLSDRGVTGRASPGPLDVFAWTERGIYRVGESVHAAALARDGQAEAEDDLPLTFVFQRPDGVEDRRIVSDGRTMGGHAVRLDLADNAMLGTWTLRVHADPKAAPVAEKMFLVEDFVPDRIEFDLTAPDAEMIVGAPTQVAVDGRYLYGAPAAGLKLEGQVIVSRMREWDDFPGFFFGLEDEDDVEDFRLPLNSLPVTGEDGKATVEVLVESVPATTQFLNAEIGIRMVEDSGRAVERSVDIEIASEGVKLGLKPEFSGGSVPEGGNASFRLIAVDPDGRRVDMPDVRWSLVRVDRDYQWYRDGGSWRYEPITSTEVVATGAADAKAGEETQISVKVNWGRYRLEVETADPGGPATSVGFEGGWYVEASSTETPDALEVALDKPSYAIGETAKLNIVSRHAGKVLVTVGADRVIASMTADVPEGGATLDVPVTADLGAGAYVTATLYRPGDAQETRMPTRSIGLKWLKVEPGARNLAVSLDLPQKALPDAPLAIPVSIGNLPAGEEAYVTVAAVDVGILNLTRYTAPDPTAWYFGQRQLGIEMRDLYGRLIDGSMGATGRIRTGGDGGGLASQGSPPVEKLVAFFSGIVQVDGQGKATVSFDIPQFNGTVRVMAVAWTKSGTGNASGDVVVRDPVVVTATPPRFLAPGDESRLLLEFANTDGPAGSYALSVAADGPVEIDGAAVPAWVDLAAGGRVTLDIPVTATGAGTATLVASLTHADGLSVSRTAILPVRPGVMPVTTRRSVPLAANGGSLLVDGEVLAASIPQGASVAVSVSRANAFDVPGMLTTLDRYPYGCAEQTTSRALPLLYVSELSASAGMQDDPALRGRVQDAIARVLSYQSSGGSFGLWSPGSGDLWLDAYVTDFLTRAREQKYDVPERAMSQALSNLQNALAYNDDIASNGPQIAYALYVLARNHKASAGDLRYYSDTQLQQFASPLSRAHLAASLALYGDVQRSAATFASAYGLAEETASVYVSRTDYGSKLRDSAAMLALAAESRPEPALVPDMVKLVSQARQETRWTSTQDEAWMLLAARAVQQANATIALEIDGQPHQGAFVRRVEGEALAGAPIRIVNRGAEPVDAMLTTVAAPQQPLPAGGEGFTIERTYFTMNGIPANVSQVGQNERFVVVIRVTEQNDWPSRIIVSDLLPAGFEIDNPRLVGSAELSAFPWLGQTNAAHLEFRDDRFVAAFNQEEGSDRTLTMAYVVRAVSPGVFMHPAASVEDMYRPQLSARTSTGVMAVRAN